MASRTVVVMDCWDEDEPSAELTLNLQRKPGFCKAVLRRTPTSWMMEAALEYTRIAFDLCPALHRVSIVAADQQSRSLNTFCVGEQSVPEIAELMRRSARPIKPHGEFTSSIEPAIDLAIRNLIADNQSIGRPKCISRIILLLRDQKGVALTRYRPKGLQDTDVDIAEIVQGAFHRISMACLNDIQVVVVKFGNEISQPVASIGPSFFRRGNQQQKIVFCTSMLCFRCDLSRSVKALSRLAQLLYGFECIEVSDIIVKSTKKRVDESASLQFIHEGFRGIHPRWEIVLNEMRTGAFRLDAERCCIEQPVVTRIVGCARITGCDASSKLIVPVIKTAMAGNLLTFSSAGSGDDTITHVVALRGSDLYLLELSVGEPDRLLWRKPPQASSATRRTNQNPSVEPLILRMTQMVEVLTFQSCRTGGKTELNLIHDSSPSCCWASDDMVRSTKHVPDDRSVLWGKNHPSLTGILSQIIDTFMGKNSSSRGLSAAEKNVDRFLASIRNLDKSLVEKSVDATEFYMVGFNELSALANACLHRVPRIRPLVERINRYGKESGVSTCDAEYLSSLKRPREESTLLDEHVGSLISRARRKPSFTGWAPGYVYKW